MESKLSNTFGHSFIVTLYQQGLWLLTLYTCLLSGGGDANSWQEGYWDAILEYDSTADSFTKIGTMTQKRGWHAISVVRYAEFSQTCV